MLRFFDNESLWIYVNVFGVILKYKKSVFIVLLLIFLKYRLEENIGGLLMLFMLMVRFDVIVVLDRF